MSHSLFIVDAFVGNFAARHLRGNPAAVVILEAPREASWMQHVAAEMNLSETAFVSAINSEISTKNEGAPGFDSNLEFEFELRWFTPVSEVKLCGHATLAAAHILWESGRVPRDHAIRFHTLSGVIHAIAKNDWLWLDFPAAPVTGTFAPPDLAAALQLSPREPISVFRAGDDFLVMVARGVVERIQPDFAWLHQISRQLKVRGFIVTSEPDLSLFTVAQSEDAQSESTEFDFVSRFFAPAIGIDEDAVTGSAHAALAPFWGAQLGKNSLIGFQVSGRGGLVRMNWRQNRVDLGGQCATFLRGTLEHSG